jgi:glycosyltransferase involved in cell wall biosynthesis
MRLAIIHDFLNQYGGAERVVGYFLKIFPGSPVYTSIYFPEDTYSLFKDEDIRTTFMQKIPGIRKHFKKYFFLYPFAFKYIRFKEDYDILLGSSSSYSHFIRKGADAVHINYCYSPPRFLWETKKYIEGEKVSGFIYFIIKPVISILRRMDRAQSERIDHYIAISDYVREKIKKTYNRDSIVIYPPIEAKKYKYSEEKKDFYLVVSRLKGYKRVDIAVEAFNMLGSKLKIVGSGEDGPGLKKIAGGNIEFPGRIKDEELLELYSGARALIFTGKEDFGLTPLEAQASGTPVIAFCEGGAAETVIDGETGVFFHEQTPDSLMDAVRLFEKSSIKSVKCRENALKFDFKSFRENIKKYVEYSYRDKFINV